MNRRGCRIVAIALLAAGLGAGFAPPQQRERVRLQNQDFVWLDAVEDAALFQWSAEVVNLTEAETLRLRVILELLDDDDRVINRDERGNPIDFVVITVEPNQPQPVVIRQQGALSYDRAAEVVQYRFRWEPIERSEEWG